MGRWMLNLSTKVIKISKEQKETSRKLWKIARNKRIPNVLRGEYALFVGDGDNQSMEGFGCYLSFKEVNDFFEGDKLLVLPEDLNYLNDGDIVGISNDGRVRSLYRKNSNHNSILITERCNNYCLMCSQPPKNINDTWLLDEALELVPMLPRETDVMCITGGEPTVYGDGFIKLLQKFKSYLPNTALHVLSNGRSFADIDFARKYSEVKHENLTVGIPVYSADPVRHDYVVQAKNAFDETIRGILNLKKLGQKVEIRVVLHKQTYEGLAELAEFICRNLLFVDRVALMGLEMTGFTRANIKDLWIDPIEYKNQLKSAVDILNYYKVPVQIYNLPLCLVDDSILDSYVKSISDWKNEYPEECMPCVKKNACGGFFSSAIVHGYSSSIKPFV